MLIATRLRLAAAVVLVVLATMTALVLWTVGTVDRAVSARRGRAQVIASGGSRTLEMPSGVSLLLAFGINIGLVGSGLWPVGLLPERKPVQPATARPHTPRYRQNPRNLALGWCPIRSFWLNQWSWWAATTPRRRGSNRCVRHSGTKSSQTHCWREQDSNPRSPVNRKPPQRLTRRKLGCSVPPLRKRHADRAGK